MKNLQLTSNISRHQILPSILKLRILASLLFGCNCFVNAQVVPFRVTADTSFSESFETGVLGNMWVANAAPNNGVVQIYSNAQYPNFGGIAHGVGIYALGMGKSNNLGGSATNTIELHLDLSDLTDVEFSFWIKNISDQTDIMPLGDGIEISNDGGNTYHLATQFYLTEWQNLISFYGKYPTIDLDKIAGQLGLLPFSSDFVIRFSQTGTQLFGNNGDGFVIDEVIVNASKPYARVPFFDNFDNQNKLGADWVNAYPDDTEVYPNTYGPHPDSVISQGGLGMNAFIAPPSPPYFVALGRRYDGVAPNPFATQALDLHLNLSPNGIPESNLEMSFKIMATAGGNDAESYDPGDGIWLSNDGGHTFSQANLADYPLDPDYWCKNVWSQYPLIDLDLLADKAGVPYTDRYVIRFQHQGDDALALGGFFLDDFFVRKKYFKPVTPQTPFLETFATLVHPNALTIDRMWAIGDASKSETLPPTQFPYTDAVGPHIVKAVTNGVYGLPNDVFYSSPYSVVIGRECTQSNVRYVNALDLRLDLDSAEQEIEMNFFAKSTYFEETDALEGIWFSDDGGFNFTKVVDFYTDQWCPDYGKMAVVDIDKLASDHGINYNSPTFVIRFQQSGDVRLDSDEGFLIDDVTVRATPSPAELPFIDNFDIPTGLQDPWQVGDPTATMFPYSGRISNNSVYIKDIGLAQTPPYYVALGQNCSHVNLPNFHALDLPVQLNGCSVITVSFWARNNFDESDPQDAVYIMPYEGNAANSLIPLNPAALGNNSYTQFQFNVNLASFPNLPLTDTIVLRIQHFDDDGFSTFNKDGIFIDSFRVSCDSNAIAVHSPELAPFSLSPNPVTQTLFITFPSLISETYDVMIVDMSGKVVFQDQLQPQNTVSGVGYDLEHLEAGVYSISFRSASGIQSKRFVKL